MGILNYPLFLIRSLGSRFICDLTILLVRLKGVLCTLKFTLALYLGLMVWYCACYSVAISASSCVLLGFFYDGFSLLSTIPGLCAFNDSL